MKNEVLKESYVERWQREQKEAKDNGQTDRSEGQKAEGKKGRRKQARMVEQSSDTECGNGQSE
ncbi:MAG: hypothetical protein IJ729_08885 [Alloprevotella sp.]|nr:hypothetical protein [Alloprevotella sp.]MBR1733827.1 hypothetical protein [Alloprevotella sp.]